MRDGRGVRRGQGASKDDELRTGERLQVEAGGRRLVIDGYVTMVVAVVAGFVAMAWILKH